MKRRTIIILSLTIVLLGAIIVAGVHYLYSGLDPMAPSIRSEVKMQALSDSASAAKPAKTQAPSQAQPQESAKAEEQAKPKEQPKAEAAAKPAEKPATAKPAEAKPSAKPAEKKPDATAWKVKNSATLKQNTLKQNADGSISLLDDKGKAQWSVKLQGAVTGAVGEVDFYAHGKLQYLLCDGSSVHLLDRLGHEVKGFPVKTPKKMVSGPVKKSVGGRNYWEFTAADVSVSYLTLKDKKWSGNLNR